MTTEVLAALQVRPGGVYADGTVGGGGHSEAVLKASAPNGKLYGCDRDREALAAARQRLAEFAGRFEFRQDSFANLDQWLEAGSCDGVLLDLGVSSPQLDWPERGFSFQSDGPLDMRMNQDQELTAAMLINEMAPEDLAGVFWEYGGEQNSRRIARAIAQARPLERTRQLAELIERVSPRAGKKAHPATKSFQALRIAVNDEIGNLRKGLEAAVRILRPGGRLAAISFNGLEDRVLKKFGSRLSRDYEASEPDVPELRRPRPAVLRWVQRKAIMPGASELAENPRARSAQCRVMEKL